MEKNDAVSIFVGGNQGCRQGGGLRELNPPSLVFEVHAINKIAVR